MLGIADAFTRRSVQVIDGRHPLNLLVHWPGYATVVASLIGFWLMQNAFNSAPLHASLPAVTAAEPTAGMVLGVVVFGDVVHISPWLVAVQIAGVLALVVGVILVARAPVFSNLRLRELPHAALELLAHPLPDHPDSGSGLPDDSAAADPAATGAPDDDSGPTEPQPTGAAPGADH
jgi:multidrug transporter EmrE-like cation transporter